MAKLLLLAILAVTATLLGQEWQLVWSDEFDGEGVDEAKWEFMLGNGTAYGLPTGWGNNELQYYRRENAIVADGNLTIIAKKEAYGGSSYTSARLRTKGKGDWLYGRFEIRAKMPIGQGIWPALWMMPTFEKYGGWAASGEIDMVEYLGHEPKNVHGTLHFGGKWPNNQKKGTSFTLKSGSFHDDFHLFTMEWDEGVIRWRVDGVLYQTQGKGDWWSSGGAFPAPFDDYFHMLFNLAVGGNWPGYPDATTQFPQELVIDYVRVYQRDVADVDEKTEAVPSQMRLLRNYPNPFNPATHIDYQLSRAGDLDLAIYNVHGECIRTLMGEFQASGQHTIRWDGRDDAGAPAPAGVYFCQLRAGAEQDMLKILLVK